MLIESLPCRKGRAVCTGEEEKKGKRPGKWRLFLRKAKLMKRLVLFSPQKQTQEGNHFALGEKRAARTPAKS